MTVSQQQRFELLARLEPRAHRILARARQIAHRLVALIRDRDAHQFARARRYAPAASASRRSVLIRSPGRRAIFAGAMTSQRIAVRAQLPRQRIPARTCLVDDLQALALGPTASAP